MTGHGRNKIARRWRADAAGNVAIEHVLIVSLIVVACIFGASRIGAKVDGFFGAIVKGLS